MSRPRFSSPMTKLLEVAHPGMHPMNMFPSANGHTTTVTTDNGGKGILERQVSGQEILLDAESRQKVQVLDP